MKAAADFATRLAEAEHAAQVSRIAVEVYGSLALTGQGHGTFDALLLGLEGSLPHNIDLESIPTRLERINRHAELQLNGSRAIEFEVARDMVVRYDDSLPKHPNGLRFTAYNAAERTLHEQIYYSVGGGFIVTDEEFGKLPESTAAVPYPFRNMAELQQICQNTGLNIAQIVVANEKALSGEKELAVRRRVSAIAQAMSDCVQRGLLQRGQLPGGLNVRRRAPDLAEKMQALRDAGQLNTQLWPMIYAMAVNEENAAGGHVVTAPTNGAAGIVPAVLHYFRTFHPLSSPRAIEDFLLTAGTIGIL